MTKHILTSLPILLFASLLPVEAQTGWKVEKTFSVGGQGGWDYLTVDPQTHRLYVPRSTHTMVIDSESGKTIADIPGQKIAHGVVLVPEAGRQVRLRLKELFASVCAIDLHAASNSRRPRRLARIEL